MKLPDDPDIAALRDRLIREADAIHVPSGDVDEVVATGRRRRWARLGAATLSVAVALGASVTVLQARDDLRPSVVGPEAPDATPTTTTEPPPSPSPSSVASAEPDHGAATATAPALLVATEDGIVRWEDGDTTAVPGIDTPVDLALPDGDGGVIFQRNDIGIGRLVDGEVSTIVSLDEFEPRTFTADYGDAGTFPVEISPASLRLRDASSGRVVFTVRHGPKAPPDVPNAVGIVMDVVYELQLGDDVVTELAVGSAYEEGYETISAGGDLTSGTYWNIILAGTVALLGDPTADPILEFDGDAARSPSTRYSHVRGGQLSRDGGTMAVVASSDDGPWQVLVLTVPNATPVASASLPLDPDHGDVTVLDHDGDLVVLGARPFGDARQPILVNIATGENTVLDLVGHAALAR